jgi:hypothetical protein
VQCVGHSAHSTAQLVRPQSSDRCIWTAQLRFDFRHML